MAGSRNSQSTDPILAAVSGCLRRHVEPAQSLVVGYSGGLDSTVLLHAASCLAADEALAISALHVHHGLSPNADVWAEHCDCTAREMGVPFSVTYVRVPRRTFGGIEAGARSLRRAALTGSSADWVLLGHHADDQAETVLHNLLRGTGVRGAAGMIEAVGRVLRPLLAVDRNHLLEYALRNSLTWIDDESNVNCRYTRNYLRHKVLPLLTDRFPAARLQLGNAARRFAESEALLDELAASDLGEHGVGFPLNIAIMQMLPELRARNVLRAMLGWKGVQLPSDTRLREFVRQIRTAASDRHPLLDLPGYVLRCERGLVHFEFKNSVPGPRSRD